MTLTHGQILQDRYRVGALLGRGGFGAIYAAEDMNLHKPVAIKENPDTSPEAQQQSWREAQILCNLSHPNLPRVTDYFVIPDTGQYLVMDYIEGKDLRTLQAEAGRGLPEAEVLAWGRQVCEALAYLHAQQPPIIHRDIKPSNIKITPRGQAILVDFGISKLYNPSLETSEKSRAVTPGYSPPEQYIHGQTDERSDIYAFGATLYKLLTGRQAPTAIERVVNRLELAPPRQLASSISPHVEAAIMCACEIEKNKRFQSIAELRQALEQPAAQPKPPDDLAASPAEADEPATASAETQPAAPSDRRGKWIYGLVGLLILLLLTGVALAQLAPLAGLTPLVFTSTAGDSTPLSAPSPTTQAATATSSKPVTASPSPSPRPPPTATPDRKPTPALGATRVSEKDGTVMVYVPAGEFLMGSKASDQQVESDEQPQHIVYLDAFWIDRTEVTNAQYARCVQAGQCRLPRSTGSHLRNSYYGNSQYDAYPVLHVTWDDAQTYCRWVERRLPTEAEWEKAARGTDGYRYPWGNAPVTAQTLNYCDANCPFDWRDIQIDDGYADSAPVGSYPAGVSLYGALDMAGNVSEWTSDWYDEVYYDQSPLQNPGGAGAGTLRVLRGGAWLNRAEVNRAAFRGNLAPGDSYAYVGFRCARSP